ncbi:MAG: MBL fold metallo-hydrolase [Melioribacteraceae bacterium]|nr:MBL fold metallo-hydrolase [Melioribacteraceae bacterium]MDD3559481.1 MBL fold metallo-hydrolase [Melioribacteraceae bacterium]
MKIQFIGAAKTVTGSMHLIECNDKKFLLDCGLYQGKRKEAFELNRSFEHFDPSEIDFLILSHAHIDHSGNIPTLVKHGFEGNIYCTFATRDLASVMLRDSAHIQEKDVEWVNKKRSKQKKNLFEPLYTLDDVRKAMKHFVGINYHHVVEVAPGIRISFVDAGHILGSAVTHIKINENGNVYYLGFSGDLGRPNLPILKDPEKIPDVDFLICESTYGARVHETPKNSEPKLAEVIKRAVQKKGKIIIPAFSVGRTQELVFALNNIFNDKLAPRIPVYVDSPLSVNATEVFKVHPECFDNETAEYLISNKDPFGFNQLIYITDVEDSKALNSLEEPHIIISSSGMCEAGRILHHLRNNIEDPKNIILMVGYAAQHTLGRRIIEKDPIVKIFGEEHALNAEVVVMESFSAHADANELVDYCNQFDKSRMQKIFLVHGEEDQQTEFRKKLLEKNFRSVEIPEPGDIFEI